MFAHLPIWLRPLLPFVQTDRHVVLGTSGSAPFRKPVQLPTDKMNAHVWCIGKTGSGKSRWLASLVLSLLNRKALVVLLDPHGDLAKLVLAHLLASGAYDQDTTLEKIVYLDLAGAARQERYLRFNVLNQPHYEPHATAQHVLESLRRAWPSLADGVAPNFENIVLAGTYVLIQNKLPLPLLHDLLVERDWREQLLDNVDDEQVVGFFRERYDRWARDQASLIESTLRRIFLLSFSPVLKHSLMSPENDLDFRGMRERGQSLLVNLGGLTEDDQRLIGAKLCVQAEQAALSMAELPPDQRGQTQFLVMDEFSMFSAQSEQSLSRILSLCRKYGLYLVMAHQTFSQTSERLQGALQNADISVAFRLGRPDAQQAAAMFGKVNHLAVKHEVEDVQALGRSHPMFYSMPEQWESWTQALEDLPPREAFLRMPDGQVQQMRSLSVPDPEIDLRRLAAIEEHYLKTYFRPRSEIDRIVAGYRKTAEPVRTTRLRPLDDA